MNKIEKSNGRFVGYHKYKKNWEQLAKKNSKAHIRRCVDRYYSNNNK